MRSKLSALILVLALASWMAAPSQHHEGMVLGQETEKKEMACCNSMTANGRLLQRRESGLLQRRRNLPRRKGCQVLSG